MSCHKIFIIYLVVLNYKFKKYSQYSIMKKSLPLFCAFLCAGALMSCSSQADDMQLSVNPVNSEQTDAGDFFPVEDDAKKLVGWGHEKVLPLLLSVTPENALSLYDTSITDEQFQEIKAFTDELVKDAKTQKEVHAKLLQWVWQNIRYEEADNDPYPVFMTRKGVCQGKANLLKVMLLSQNIPVISANGFTWGMGHAWLYTYLDGDCYLSDPTNNIMHEAKNTSACIDFNPYFLEYAVFEDDRHLVEYSGGDITLVKVKSGNTKYTVPYSAGGFVVTAFNPESAIPENIKEIYIGKNIESLAYQNVMGLQRYGEFVEKVHVDPKNEFMEDYEGLIYHKKGDTTTPYYIPPFITRIVLKPNPEYGKGVIVNHQYVEEIIFPDGVKKIGDYTVERCPNLKRVYIPQDATITENALYNMSQHIEIIRDDDTGTDVPIITVD